MISQKMVPKLRSRGMLWTAIGGGLEQKFHENCLFIDLAQGARLALEYLIKLGHRKICYCFAEREAPLDARMRVFKGFFSKLDTSFDNFLPIRIPKRANPLQIKTQAYKAVKQRLRRNKKRYSALFCQNDLIALGALDALRETNLRVPDDIAIVGFDDRPEARESTPGLTTVKIPFEEIGYEAVRQVKGCFKKGRLSFPSIKLPCRLITRDSCGGKKKI